MRILSLLLIMILLSCGYTKKINNGQVAYDSKRYSVAIDLLQKEYDESSNQELRAKKSFLLGKSHHFLNDNKQALFWYSRAVEHGYGAMAIREKAFTLKKEEKYVEAARTFEQLERETGRDPLITREINICKQALNWLEPKKGVAVTIFPFAGNSRFMDYSPEYFKDEYVVFSSDRIEDSRNKIYEWTGNGYADLYVMDRSNGEVLIFDQPINSEHNEATAAFNADFTQMYFTRCFTNETDESDEYCRLMYSILEDERWSEPKELSFQSPNNNYGHPTLIQNDSVLVFTMKASDGSETYDLYYSVLEEDGWVESIPMPSSLNTDGNEKFPVSDGDTLYFSSDYLPGLGGLDIFKTYLRSDNSWAPPENLKAPFNSGADDFGLIMDRTKMLATDVISTGYFSSTRDFENNDNIFGFEVRKKAKSEEEQEEEIVDNPRKDFKVYIAGRVVLNKYQIENNPSTPLVGKDPLSGVAVSMSSVGEQYSFVTDGKGRFLQEVSVDQNFNINALKEGFLSASKNMSTENLKVDPSKESITINVELSLEKIEYNKEIVLNNIYYDFDKWAIRSDAKPSLDRLSDLLSENASIVIELASHTDCEGNNAYNQNLSQKRAQSAVNYLISKGIAKQRMAARGYGETRLQETCVCDDCTDEQHQKNRRTTFKILRGE